MIYLDNIVKIQSVYIPCDIRDMDKDLVLDIVGTINHHSFRCKATIEKSHQHYCRVFVQLPEGISSGEYEYTMSDSRGVLSSGLLVIAENDSHVEYVIEKEYEQYEN